MTFLTIGAAVLVAAVVVLVLAVLAKRRNTREHKFDAHTGEAYGHLPAEKLRQNDDISDRFDGSSRDELERYAPAHDVEIPQDETDDERRLRKLREFQRAEKIREAQEEAELAAREMRESQSRDEIEDDDALRLRQLREFQRAEKIREAAEDLELNGPDPELDKEQPIGTLITQEVIDMRRQEQQFKDREQKGHDQAEVSRVVGEARDLINDMNAQFGWQMGEASIPDRLFNTDVESVLGATISRGKVDFRTHKMVATMRTFARAQTGGRTEIAKVMAARVLLGSGQLTEEESSKLNSRRHLFGDNFAEAAGFTDHMTRQQEIIQAKKLGLAVSRESSHDMSQGVGLERNR